MDLHSIDASVRNFFRQTARKSGDLLLHCNEGNVATVKGSTSLLGSEDLEELELLSESLHIDKETIRDGEISIRRKSSLKPRLSMCLSSERSL
jgi:hypothetical protein